MQAAASMSADASESPASAAEVAEDEERGTAKGARRMDRDSSPPGGGKRQRAEKDPEAPTPQASDEQPSADRPPAEEAAQASSAAHVTSTPAGVVAERAASEGGATSQALDGAGPATPPYASNASAEGARAEPPVEAEGAVSLSCEEPEATLRCGVEARMVLRSASVELSDAPLSADAASDEAKVRLKLVRVAKVATLPASEVHLFVEVVGPPCTFAVTVRSPRFRVALAALALVVGPPAGVRINGKAREVQTTPGEDLHLSLCDAHGNSVRCAATLAVETHGAQLLVRGAACTSLTLTANGSYLLTDYTIEAPTGHHLIRFVVHSCAATPHWPHRPPATHCQH